MARLQLNKSSLAREQTQLKSYERFLPSLDLKRQQLMAERVRAREEVKRLEHEVQVLSQQVGEKLPMLAQQGIDLEGLVELRDYKVKEVNVVGVKMPDLVRIDVVVRPYPVLTKPHWVDVAARLLHDMVLYAVSEGGRHGHCWGQHWNSTRRPSKPQDHAVVQLDRRVQGSLGAKRRGHDP
ncbi:V-type ATP synthase subunit D [Ruegeria sp. AD91A]|uniref:V-type ATP synthase subunit D n=1 Tax=Ruegeria sp. AD91A TaxID=2293862 RepID=UPI0013C30315|nr:V-type ATP synthase subunit D [Ruegeria sp. AD91A]